MARSRDLKIVIAGDADKLDREIRRANGSLDKLGKQTRMTASISSRGYSAMKVGATGAAAAIGGLVIAGKAVVEAAIESEKSQARLATQLKASGLSYRAHAAEIDRVIQKTSQLAGLDDEDLQDAFTNIVRVTGDVNKSLRLTGLAADFARAKHMDVAKAGEIVGKVAGGNIGILSRYGFVIDKNASSSEALAALQTKFAGQAEAYGKTTGGSVDRANVAFENLQETIGGALAPAVEDAATKVADFVNEMQDGTGQGGRFVRKLRDIWQETKPIVTWIGRAAKNVAEFTAKHPEVAKLAVAVLAVGAAVKTLRFVSAASGFSTLLKVGTSAAKLLRKRMVTNAAAAGAESAIASAAGFSSQSGKFSGAGKKAGRLLGRGAAIGMLAGVGLLASEFSDKFVSLVRKHLGDTIGDAVSDALPGGKLGQGALKSFKRALGLNTGGVVPGRGDGDTVPAMLTPGEFVIRKSVVERFGPTFFAGLNGTMGAPQGDRQVPGFTSGGIVSRANKMDAMDLPYLWGGGHGGPISRGVDCSGAVSYALGVSPRVSGGFMSWGKPGPGSPNDTKVYANAKHVFAVFNGRGWGTGKSNPGGGPGWLPYNHRSGFTIRHIDDGALKGTGTSGDPEEKGPTAGELRDLRRERAERAGSRAVNKITAPFARGISAATRGAASLGTAIEDAGTSYGQTERVFGMTDEDLGTPSGRAARVSEIGALVILKKKTLANQKKRAALLRTAISKTDAQLKKLRAARDKAKGAKRAKMNERIRPIIDRRDDLAAELKALGVAITDTQLDIGDLAKEAADVAKTPDTEDTTVSDTQAKIAQAVSDIDLMERAGLITPDQAAAMRVATLQAATTGKFGALDQRGLLEVLAQLGDASKAQAEAAAQAAAEVSANTQALLDLRAEVEKQNAIAGSIIGIQLAEAQRALGDMLSGQIGTRVANRSMMPGSGQLSRL